MRKLKLFFACMLLTLLSIGQVWGADVTSKMDLDDQSPACTANTTSYTGTQSATWSLSKTCAGQSVGTESNANSDKYYQIGSSSKNATSMTWSSSSFNGKKIKQVVVKCSSSASATGSNKATVTVTASGGTFSPATSGSNVLSGSTYTTVTFNSSASGGDQISGSLTVDIAFSSQQQKNIRLYQIDVVYVSGETPSCTDPETALSITNANTVVLGSTLELTTNGGNGGNVSWTVAAGTGTASVSGNVLTPLTKGTVTVTATQDVNGDQCGAAPTQTVTITKAAPAPIEGTIADELTSATFSSTGSYTAFTNKQASNTGHSPAVYAGKTSRNGNATKYNIQLNTITSTGNPAGSAISTTTSGGLVKRVYVTWATQSTNTANRKLTVYGKNDAAYTGTETAVAGTKIGDIVYASGDTYEYLDITNDYKYIQIVANGAIYMDQIDVYWLPIKSAITIDDDVENGSVGVSGIANLDEVAAGTEVTLSNTPDDGYKLTAYDVYKTGETATKVTVTNGKFEMPDYAVTVSASFEATKALSSITLSGTQRTEFWVGETFSSTGLVVTAHYDDESSAEVTPASISSPDMSTPGEKAIMVTYTEGTTESNTYTINVKALPTEANPATVAEIHDLYDRLGNTSNTYVRGTIYKLQTFYNNGNADDGKYTYWLTDEYDGEAEPNHSNEFEIYKGLDFNGAVFSSAEDIELGQEVVVNGDLTKWNSTYEFNGTGVIVSRPKVLKGIALSGSQPTEFTQGDEFSSAGLIVTASYNYGDPAAVTPTSITGYNMSATGNQTVTVSYTEGGVTKTATYGISVAAPDLCEHKATISKGAEVNGTFSLSVSGEQCLDELDGYKTSTVLTASPAEHYHLSEVTATVGTVGTISENSCTISNITANTTVTAVFTENDKVTIKFDNGTESATGDVPTDVADKYAGQSITLPANPFTYTGSPIKVFGGWKHSLTNEVKQPGSYTITAADAAEDNITFTAVWNDLSPWATVYTSNVTLSGSQTVNVTITVDEEDTNFAGVKMNKGAAATFTIPAGTTHLYAHMAAWNGESQTVTVSGDCFDDDKEISIIADANVSGSGTTFDINDTKAPLDYFKEIVLDNEVTEPTEITITAASGKRFVLFGVNAVYPAAITLDPVSKDFGEVKENANAQFEFTITPNAMSTGGLSASIIGTDAAKFSVGAISENKVTVTFSPGEVGGPYSASLKVESGNAEVTAALSGTGITSATPEIGIDKTEVAFGNVEQNSTPATQSVAVTLSNIGEDGVSAAINGSVFSLSTNKLTENGSIVITPVTTTPGTYSETLTLSATGATSKYVTVTMTVVDEWAYVYTSNVTIASNTNAQVTIDEDNYAAAKTSKGASATITLPQGVTKIHMHLVAWKGEAQTVTVSGDCFDEDKEIDIIANDGVSGSGTTYPLGASGVAYYCSLTPDNEVAANTVITISAASGSRFVLFGVNQEGGIVPVLQSLAVSGDLENKTYEAGASINPAGLTVMGTYTLGGTPQTPVDVTDQVEEWLYDALQTGDETVTISAKIGTVTSEGYEISGLTVTDPTPTIYVDKLNVNFGTVAKDASVEAKTITITLKNVAAATATLAGTNPEAFSIDDTDIASGDVITISVASATTETIGEYSATITITDNAGVATQKVVNISLAVEDVETPVSTTSKWVAATAATASYLVDGKQVLITGVKSNVTYAISEQGSNNRTTAAGTLDEGVFTPGESTMPFTLVAQDNGTFALQTSNGKYLYAASSSGNQLKTRDAIGNDGKAVWTISIGENNVASIVANCETANWRNVMRFNPNGNNEPIVACYETASQSPITLYVKQPKVIDDKDQTGAGVGTNDDVEIAQDKTWTVNNEKTVGDVHMQEGAIIANSANVTANDLFFKARHGKSNQIFDLSKITVVGSLYYDFQLCNGELEADYWYSISVPFDVDLNSGVFQTDGTPMVNRQDFEVWSYNTQKRADTQYNGWERVTDNMMHAGKAYLIGFNPGQPNVIRLKAAADWKTHLFSGTSMSVTTTTSGGTIHDNWNGFANPTGRYISVNKKTQVFNNNNHKWDTYDPAALDFTFVVGTAFFVQSADAVAISSDTEGHDAYRAPQRAGNEYAYAVRITREGATEFDNQMIIRASEDATNAYELGHDMLTMNNATSNTAAMIWTVNYGGKRLAIEEAPLVNDQAIYDLRIYAPTTGTYSLSAAAKEGATLYVTYNGAIVWNLSLGDYELDLTRGTTTGYGLLLVAQPNQMPTGLDTTEGVSGDAVQKILLNGQLYILRDGHLFDAVGHEMK